ncbi:hypothetical protein SEUCBS140593_003327 [Sporothrix eucalyptigena]|uniref:Alcohol dehydrogenase-like C-terminal domain-containing protein n=1 Tax=Sporothrix eucalyptigena TaxID=1812306 RepID=A0ABP0BE70_9PEZI
MCDNEHITGVTRDEGFAEYAVVRADGAVHLPKDCDPIGTAPLLCAGVTVSTRFAASASLKAAWKMGYDVVVISSGESKRDYAAELGAIGYINATTEDPAEALKTYGRAVAIVSTAPNPATVGRLLYGMQELGTLLVLSLVMAHALDSADTVRFARRHGIKVMIERYKFANFHEAFERMLSGKARFKVELDMQ